MLTSLNVGLQYQLDRYDYKANHAAYDLSDKYFLSLAYTGRVLRRSGNDFAGGHGLAVSVGKWYTPLSSWRLGLDYGYYGAAPRYMSLALSADYMFNLSAFTAGYNSDRLFDLIALGGVYAGVGNSQKKMNLFMASEREYKDGSMYLRVSICLSSLSFLHLVFLGMTMAWASTRRLV